MKFEILLTENIDASQSTAWHVISDLDSYANWNPFVVKCQSNLSPGSPIIMHVKVIQAFTMRQKETIRDNREGEFLEYGINIPGLLHSTRQHKLKATSDKTCQYESVFCLKGPLAPIVGFILGKNLRRGFIDMTTGLKLESEKQSRS